MLGVSSGGTFPDVDGRLVVVPPPDAADEVAIASFRSGLNARMAPEAILERIRRHTALIAEGRRGVNA